MGTVLNLVSSHAGGDGQLWRLECRVLHWIMRLNMPRIATSLGSKSPRKQAIAFMLAEMATEIEAIRLLGWEAAWQLDNGKPEAYQNAYLALTGAVDMAMMVTDRAVQTLGGHGYIREHPVEFWMRNGRGIARSMVGNHLIGLAG